MKKQPLLLITLQDAEAASAPPNAARFALALDAVRRVCTGPACTDRSGCSGKSVTPRDAGEAPEREGKEGETCHLIEICGAGKARDFLERRPATHPLSVIFAVLLPADGVSLAFTELLRLLRTSPALLENCTGGVIVDGASELYTKSAAAQLVFAANRAGCAFIGRPLVEATGSLSNFTVTAGNLGTDLESAYLASVRDLVTRLYKAAPAGFAHTVKTKHPRLLALHASSHETSNTYALWHGVRKHLAGIETREIGLRNGVLVDCSGCPFNMCLHFGERDSCFYGGVMTDDVYPALREADAVLMICPNYNDAISANMTAFINRLTAMYRKQPFSDKSLFAIVVSGYSGSDIVASQLIAALNMNKSFFLPPRFALLATANDPGSVMRIPDIDSRIRAFAENIRDTLCGGDGLSSVCQRSR